MARHPGRARAHRRGGRRQRPGERRRTRDRARRRRGARTRRTAARTAGTVGRRGGDDAATAPTVVARAVLEPLPGWDTTGQAVVEEGSDGQRLLVVTLDAEQGDGGFREVWLIDREVSRLVSLGVLEGTEGTFTVPAGLDLGDFPVVDVSEEPYDGNPAHSGASIIHGILDA
nr:anti-sigma factor [Cellulomonas sp. KRMCY2]